ncbi:MAG: hypothetical protein ABJC39_07205 [Chloroflexota bacterium]
MTTEPEARPWTDLREPSDEAARVIRRTGVEHYEEHLGRLEAWVENLKRRREG